MEILNHLNWNPPSVEINDEAFNVEITEGNIDILCEWDHGWGGRGTESCSIPLEVFKGLIEQYENATKRQL